VAESKRKFIPFVIYVISFHVFWMVGFVFWIYPWMKSLGETTLRYALINVTIRLLVWVLPVFLYLIYVDGLNPIEYLRLRKNWQRGLIIGIVLSVINFLGSMARFGIPHLSAASFTWNSIISTSFLIGFVEEIPYRGFHVTEVHRAIWILDRSADFLDPVFEHSPSGLDLSEAVQSRHCHFGVRVRRGDGISFQIRKVIMGTDHCA